MNALHSVAHVKEEAGVVICKLLLEAGGDVHAKNKITVCCLRMSDFLTSLS